MKTLWTLTLFCLCVCAPAVSAQDPESADGAEQAAAKAALVEEIRDLIVWYDREKESPVLIPEEVFDLLPLEELPIPKNRGSIRLWIARQQEERSADATAVPCPYPGTVSHRLTPGAQRISLEEAMAAPLAVLLVKVDRTRVGIRPDLGIYQYNEVSIVDVLPGAAGRDQNPLTTRAFLSEGGNIEVEGTQLCSKSPWHRQAPRSGDTYLLLGSSDRFGIFNATLYFRVEGGDVVPASYSELELPEKPFPLARTWAAASRLRNAIPPAPRITLLSDGERPRDPWEDEEIPDQAMRASGPGGRARTDADVFCEEFQGLCDSSTYLAWRSQDACVATCRNWSSYGDKAGFCNWTCGPEPEFPAWQRKDGAFGNGPNLAFLNIRDGDTITGRPVLRGFAMTWFRKVSIDLFWNGRRLPLRSLKKELPSPEACSLPLGLLHGHCVTESGFEVEIDSTLLPNGPGRLALVSTTDYGWTSSLELDLVVANRH